VRWHFCLGIRVQLLQSQLILLISISEMLQYTQKRVTGIEELEKRYKERVILRLNRVSIHRLASFGYRVGLRELELILFR
jgi:hypothetical protein